MSKKQYRIEHDPECESPRAFGVAEVWSTSNNRLQHRKDKNWHYTGDLDATLAELQLADYVYFVGVGMVFAVSPVTLQSEFFGDKQGALSTLTAEYQDYVAWREGECYRYVVYEVQACSLGHAHEVEIDSCGGFYGYTAAMGAAMEALRTGDTSAQVAP